MLSKLCFQLYEALKNVLVIWEKNVLKTQSENDANRSLSEISRLLSSVRMSKFENDRAGIFKRNKK